MCVYIHNTETLPEPVRLREFDAKEDAKLSEFQAELVQMAAVLCGDHRKDIFPHKLVEGMNVISAVEYVENAFTKFLEESEKLKQCGASEDTICIPEEDEEPPKLPFASKFFSCIFCGKN